MNESTLSMEATARLLNVNKLDLFQFLRDRHFLTKKNLATDLMCVKELAVNKSTPYIDSKGKPRVSNTVQITRKGAAFIEHQIQIYGGGIRRIRHDAANEGTPQRSPDTLPQRSTECDKSQGRTRLSHAKTLLSEESHLIFNWDKIKRHVVIIDVETTGVDDLAEVIEVGIVSGLGQPIISTLVKPLNQIPKEATAVHGISNADVEDAPTFDQVYALIKSACEGKIVVAYNWEFEQRMLNQSAKIYDLDMIDTWACEHACAMNAYAEYHAEPDEKRGGYRWQKLTEAAQQLSIKVNGAHRAYTDARLTLDVIESAFKQATKTMLTVGATA